ncbi:MAG: S-adenosylmethionine decarboxylase [Terriglobia bacterium]
MGCCLSGVEWLVEAFGCKPQALRELAPLQELFLEIVHQMQLQPIGEPVWHRFAGPGGVTGVWLLAESHLAIHSFPEFSSACLNVFCCRPRPALDWDTLLSRRLCASQIEVRQYSRCYDRSVPSPLFTSP